MKKRLVIIICSIILIILTLGVYCYINLYSKEKVVNQNENLSKKMEDVILNSTVIDFNKIISFNWDKMYIVTPYIDPKEVFKQNNIKWREISTAIITNDSINLIVFTNNGEIVSYINYPRSKGDFAFIKGKEFNKNTAIFNIEKSSSEIKISSK